MFADYSLPFAQTDAAHPFGWLSLVPPLVAVVMAIATKRVYVSLLTGIAVGALIMSGGEPVEATAQLLETHLFRTLIEESKLRLMTFTLLIGATIGIVSASGGMTSLVQLFSPLARGRRSGQLVIWASGLLVFFDDYANTLLLGSTFQSTCDRLRISREKLAYLVDSTAAPVAGLAIVSTWIAVEIGYIEDGLKAAGADENVSAFNLFLACIPYRFYVIQALLLVLIIAITGRDFGPMKTAEQDAADGKKPTETAIPPVVLVSSHWLYAVLPIVVTLVVVVWLMIYTGWQKPTAEQPIGSLFWLRDTFGAASSNLSLQYGGLVGFGFAILLCRATGKLPGRQLWAGALEGTRAVLPAVLILWLAGALSRMTGNETLDGVTAAHRLYTGNYLEQMLITLSESPAAAEWFKFLLPTVVFVLSSFVAFSTGTSFGTMGILLPMIVPLAHGTLAADSVAFETEPLLLASVGSVMAGAIFGDHCSPISDTTILSSQASGCDHIAHVNTQMPYALLGAGVSILFGTLLVGSGINPWLLVVLQTLAMVAFVFVFGRRTTSEPHALASDKPVGELVT